MVTQPVEVFTFTTRNDSVLSRRERGDFIDENCDRSLSACNKLRMTTDDKLETLDRIGDGGGWSSHFFIQLVKAEIHDVKKEFFFTVDIVIQSRLRHPDCISDVVN